MEYPKHNCCLTFERTSKDFCNIKNCFTEEEWETETKYAYLLKALDGHTDPYKINPDLGGDVVETLLRELNRAGLLDSGERITPLGLGSILFSLWIPQIGKVH